MKVTLDYPQKKSLPAEQKAYNEKTKGKYGIRGYPTVLVLDSQGSLYASTGYQKGGPANYMMQLGEFAERKRELADLQAKLKRNPNDVAATEQLVERAGEWDVLIADYLDLKVKLASMKGPNQARHAIDLARQYLAQRNNAKYKEYLEKARALDPGAVKEVEDMIALGKEVGGMIQKKDWEGVQAKLEPLLKGAKGNMLQEAHWLAGMSEYSQQNKDKAIEHLEKALAAAPGGPRAKEIPDAIKFIRSQ